MSNFVPTDSSQQPSGCTPLPSVTAVTSSESDVQFSALSDVTHPCTQVLPPFCNPQHGYAVLPPSLPFSRTTNWEARLRDDCRKQFHARLECRKLNDPYSKIACRERTHALEQYIHDVSKSTAKIRQSMERSKEEHEHWMRKQEKKLQKIVDVRLAKEQREKDCADQQDWQEFISRGWENGRTGDGRRETGDGRRETGDGRRETGDGRRETGDGRRETGDGRRETGDGRRETGDGRRETGDGRRETGEQENRRTGGWGNMRREAGE
ncbi:hypothetical protein DEU56DRAFT_762029 [Suillus clintonianus]|uniref:uncharacterized protein n=1 Tax=Suillus clintonianus TaxID=1904413 RepID=UPI001B85BE5F|nr:uncharacterized protein DEU56DRAFT_762029 [Suillus clintonianus]KAG2112517.1 hypothetical protein DEU56DRAFT_762029 [Suillus clintonianus]